jgi:DNA invertase Pin-like site-specific DNA recombinase
MLIGYARVSSNEQDSGLETARSEGRIGGRPPKLTRQQQTEIVRRISRGRKTAADAARLFGVHPATISRLLSRVQAGRQPQQVPTMTPTLIGVRFLMEDNMQ